MIDIFKHPIFIVAASAFWINQYLEKTLEIFVPTYHAYGDDLMAMPVVFGICLQLMRWFHPLKSELTFSKKQLLIGLIYFSVIFELVLPQLSTAYTADLLDVLCYLVGTLVFYRFMNKPVHQPRKPQAL